MLPFKWHQLGISPIKWHQLPLTLLSKAFTHANKKTPTPGSDAACLAEALSKRSVPWRGLGPYENSGEFSSKGRALTFRLSTKNYFFQNGRFWIADSTNKRMPGPLLNGPIVRVIVRKDLTNSVLRQYGVSVPQGIAIARDALNQAEILFDVVLHHWLNGVCVKPANGQYGQNVYIGLRDWHSFRAAFKSVGQHCAHVLIEETVTGQVYRLFCVGGRVVAIRLGIPAHVEGDGVHNISELIDLQNVVRQRNPTYRGLTLSLESVELKSLAAQGMRVDWIPVAGERVWLGTASNLHQGALTVDATEDLHPSYVSLVEDAVLRFPGLVICGVDFAAEQPNAPANGQNCHIIEINSAPGFADFHYPFAGKSRDVAGAIVDYLLRLG